MAQTRISIAKPDIVRFFENSTETIFDLRALRKIFVENHSFWRLAQSMSCKSFIDYLIKNSKLKKEIFNFSYRPVIRYIWGEVPFYELILALKPKSYFSHYSAMYFHELTEQIPKEIYITFEQESKPRSKSKLVQGNIDFAFKCATRLSNNIAKNRGHSIRLLNGMQTENTGVIESFSEERGQILLTDVERTLIDIAVRPEYSGGPFEVLKAYKLAKSKVSVNRLSALLKKIDYIYPYHQVIGFYLDHAGGYKNSQIDLLRKSELKYNFYLMHKMKQTSYSKKWKLYFPKGFD